MGDDFDVRAGEHVTGEVMHEYLNAYARKWDLPKRIDLRTRVTMVERLEEDGGSRWRLAIQSPSAMDGNLAESTIMSKKLVVSTGVTNNPHRPNIAGMELFDAPIFHSAALGREQKRLLSDPGVRTVAVLGGGKSAYDAVYLAASAGRQVLWLMRRSGRGPAWVFPLYTNIGPFKVRRDVRQHRLEIVVRSR